MSLAKVRELAKHAAGAFVQLSGALLAEALREFGANPAEKGSLFEHVLEKVRANPDCVMQVHRDVHLGPLLNAVNVPQSATPGNSTIET